MKAMIIGALTALGVAAGAPAWAQDTSGQMGAMGGNSSSMSTSPMASRSMSKSQMATMKRCQAMSSDIMMKNKKCSAMVKMHPEMMQPASSGSGN